MYRFQGKPLLGRMPLRADSKEASWRAQLGILQKLDLVQIKGFN